MAPSSLPLETRLAALADVLREHAPQHDDGEPAELVALLPCEPVVGECAVACWVDRDGGELFELVELDGGRRHVDAAALRESLALLAMAETMEELAAPDSIDEARAAIAAWQGAGPAGDPGAGVGATGGAGGDPALAASLTTAFTAGDAALARVRELVGDDLEAVRIARPSELDALAGALRELDTAWALLEQAAVAWSDDQLAAAGEDMAVVGPMRERVQDLWAAIGVARRGPLAQPVATAVQSGREAGVALAAAIAAAD